MFVQSRQPHPTTRSAPSGSRRESIEGERSSVKRLTALLSALKSAAKVVTAAAATGLLLMTYILPAYADQGTAASHPLAPAATREAQALNVNSAVEADTESRDGYAVTSKPKVVANAYSRTADTFANNPANLVIQWPFSRGVPIASGFGPRVSPCGGCSSFHEGLDLNPGAGTPIQAIADGVVSDIGNPSGSFGVFAVIDHVIDGQKVSSLYAHMLRGSLAMAVGDPVKKGQLVGQVGSTGASSGAHLHLGILLNGTTPIDPYAWLKQKVGS
jgi:murein DD-endopeptidase MepM/ murein hydrolase activator NlpD